MNQSEAGAGLRPLTVSKAEGGALAIPEGPGPATIGASSAFTPSTSVPPPLSRSSAPRDTGASLSGSKSPAPSAQGAVPAPGTRIHQYELIRKLGSGGMGTVFLARDLRLGRRVAIKFLHSTAQEITRRFILEARATARCSHENIVVIHEVGEFQGSPFMVLEFLQGQSLHKLVGGQRLPPARAVELMVPVVRALACAHAEGIVHRDLKPDNILVTESGTLKVLDFGIAKVLQDPSPVPESPPGMKSRAAQVVGGAPVVEPGMELTSLTHDGALMGTLSYMSPEQWGNGVPVDHRTDIWAVGIILFRMLAGRHPLEPLRGPQLAITAFLDETMPRLRDVAPEVPAEVADVVDRCLLKRKEERFPDAPALLRALEPFLPGRYTRELRVDESPYAGLSSFQEADADRFFGRSREIAALVSRLRDRPLMAVVGPSGAGKSSFVRAGLVPVLKRSGEAWETHVVRPGRDPLGALVHLLAPLVTSSSSLNDELREHHKLAERLRQEPGIVGSVLRGRARRQRQRVLLFVDQFEELYTLVPDAQERRAFTACLTGLADDATSPIRVVLSLRSDFLDRVPEDERFMTELNQGLFFLAMPQREGLQDALVQPAEMAGYRFETPDMVESMLQHLESTQGALPLLQFAATQLWDRREQARKLFTEQSYRAMGGIAGALASHADSVLHGLSPQGHALARAIFLRLVTPERTRALVTLEELHGLSQDTHELQRVTDQLVQARLLVVQTGGGATGATVELVHESLIQGWPTLKHWLDESQEDSAFLEQLRNAARQWQAKRRDGGLLWRGEMVEEARRFQRRYRGELPKLQQDFLKAVFAQAERAAHRRRSLAVGAIVFLSLLVAASAVAVAVIRKEQRTSEENARRAQASAEVAVLAEGQARQSLTELRAKEEERQKALQEAKKAGEELAQAYARLQRTNGELSEALEKARSAEERAQLARKRADRHAWKERLSAEEARRLAAELEKKRQEDQERINELYRQLGELVPELE
ncbi:serine/threonine-protein kinase [Hyalangium versicolor]|uniref:serine/threonine-protein kinase n=1 Tax=Hyalangium versicolor TaxID=2861190 RepID=UPI001CCFA502|nr:serine/threonine-protein kinase [Hyalangium versicolor]